MEDASQKKISVKDIYEINHKKLELEVVIPGDMAGHFIDEKYLHRPGLALAGFVDLFTYNRVQILGNTEIEYISQLTAANLSNSLKKVFEFDIPMVIVTGGNQPLRELIDICREKNVTMLKTKFSTTEVSSLLGEFLDEFFAPEIMVHGSMVDVYGIGILITGESGIGKSEIALDLVERGHRIVADDTVRISRHAGDILIAKADEKLLHYMEIRGVGIIDVRNMFGIRAVRVQKRLEVELRLELWDGKENYERIGIEDQFTEILRVNIPIVRLPINPGKNITVIAEVIALKQLLKIYGHNAALEFNQKLIEIMKQKKEGKGYLQQDYE